ncbi:multidrug transporter [Ferroacidibacillus organovorans]|uniref:Multidrug transporter n=1 Tax=Ferroacidibacillus organovorans TaxID=1765683 RepID=A0A101XQG3_9BACL|nr:multidrug transporter [Ferroacidibacillus organovorans]
MNHLYQGDERVSNRLKADLAMLMVTMFWGSSYLFMKLGLMDVHALNLIAMRFGIAFLLSGTIFYKRLLKVDKRTFYQGMILGVLLFFVFVAITYGVQYTSVTHAGFLVSLAVVFVPILTSTITKQKVQIRVIVSVCTAILGVGLLTLNDKFRINPGDILCILGAILYAIHIIVTSVFTRTANAITLGTIQLGFTGLLGLFFGMFFDKSQLPDTPSAWVAVLALGILCSAFGFIVQTVTQKYTPPTHTGLIFSTEPVFTVIFAYFFQGETLSLQGIAGASIVLLSVIFAEIDPQKLFTTVSVYKRGVNVRR